MTISIVVATGKNGEIGKDNQLLWKIPKDMTHFKNLTIGETVVMGRKTFESIGKLLPHRTNVILTSQENLDTGDGRCIIAKTPDEVLDLMNFFSQDFYIIGGAEIYKLFLPHVDKVFLTYVDHEFEADTFFPKLNEDEFELIAPEKKGVKNKENPYDYYFREYQRK